MRDLRGPRRGLTNRASVLPLLAAATFAVQGCGDPFQGEVAEAQFEGGLPVIEVPYTPNSAVPAGPHASLKFGYPDGAQPVPPVPYMYSPDEMATSAPQADAFKRASIDVLRIAEGAGTWLDASARVQAYVEAPPAETSRAPRYLLDQLAVHALASRSDFPAPPVTDEEADVLAGHLRTLTETRSGNVVLGAEIVRRIGDRLPDAEVRDASSALLANGEQYDAKMSDLVEMVASECEECRESDLVRDLASLSPETQAARASLSAAAR